MCVCSNFITVILLVRNVLVPKTIRNMCFPNSQDPQVEKRCLNISKEALVFYKYTYHIYNIIIPFATKQQLMISPLRTLPHPSLTPQNRPSDKHYCALSFYGFHSFDSTSKLLQQLSIPCLACVTECCVHQYESESHGTWFYLFFFFFFL